MCLEHYPKHPPPTGIIQNLIALPMSRTKARNLVMKSYSCCKSLLSNYCDFNPYLFCEFILDLSELINLQKNFSFFFHCNKNNR